ncbi:tryptophan synthase subunit alpha [soil metagenome]
MNALDNLFQQKKKDVLAVYFTAGFPLLNDTTRIIDALNESGADIIEIGIPFSDPLADGPVIQESSRVALENGMNMKLLFQQLSSHAPISSHAPNSCLVLMGYLNPVLQFGVDEFLAACVKTKISGVILPDLPLEVYEAEYKTKFENAGVHFIFLITPTTPEDRIRKIASLSKGFLYLVSTSATTGGTAFFEEEKLIALKRITDLQLGIPVLTGFGIHDRITFLQAASISNGAIIGTAFLKALNKDSSKENIANFISSIKTEQYDYSIR